MKIRLRDFRAARFDKRNFDVSQNISVYAGKQYNFLPDNRLIGGFLPLSLASLDGSRERSDSVTIRHLSEYLASLKSESILILLFISFLLYFGANTM